jgi:hypothetical protein
VVISCLDGERAVREEPCRDGMRAEVFLEEYTWDWVDMDRTGTKLWWISAVKS